MASMAAFVYFWSSAYEVSGGCATDTLYPSFLRMLATASQPEPSANAPCTRTTFLIVIVVLLFSFQFFSHASALVSRCRSCDIRRLQRFRMAFRSASLLQHPFPDVWRAVKDRDPCRLTRVEKTNTFDICEIEFLQIQRNAWSSALDLSLQLIQVPRPKDRKS